MIQALRIRQRHRAHGHRPREAENAHVAVRLHGIGKKRRLRLAHWRRERHFADFPIVVIRVKARLPSRRKGNERSHRLLFRHPRTAAHRPAGAVLKLERKPPRGTFVGKMRDEASPLRA